MNCKFLDFDDDTMELDEDLRKLGKVRENVWEKQSTREKDLMGR